MKNEMARSVLIRRLVAVLLCCLLAFHQTLPVAHAAEPVTASLTIAAGAMALGGLSAAAIENTIGPQIAAVIGTTMQGLGTSVYTTEQSALTKTKFIMSKIAVWCYQAKIAKEDFYKRVAQGITVAANGTIQLTHDASKLISQFISWIFTQDGLTVPEVSSLPRLEFGDVTMDKVESGNHVLASGTFNFNSKTNPYDSIVFNFSSSGPVFSIYCSGDGAFLLLGQGLSGNNPVPSAVLYNGSSAYTGILGGGTGLTASGVAGFNYVLRKRASGVNNFKINSSPVDFITSYTSSQVLNLFKSSEYSIVSTPGQDVFVGTEAEWAQNKDLLNPAIDNVTTITPDLINKLIDQLADGQTATMDIASYLDSLVDAFDGLKSQVAELTDAVTGAKTNVVVPDSITTDVTVDPVNPISVPAVEPVELTPGGTIEGFSFPLDEIFPFCIPFDVVAALELFDVPAEAPSLHVHWELPYNIVFDFDLDLSAYDDIAALLRVMETILFAVGLAVATRSLYIRS